MPTSAWYKKVLTREFDPATSVFVLFADNVPGALDIIAEINSTAVHTVVVDEDYVSSLALMTLCKHHVGTVSSYGFWGAYLDQKQPRGGRTLFPAGFQVHYRDVWPYRNWEIIENVAQKKKKAAPKQDL